MKLSARQAAALASDLARAFGLKDARGALVVFAAPTDDQRRDEITTRLRRALDEIRPVASAPSVGEALAALLADVGKAAPGKRGRSVRRRLWELDELVALGAYGRAKRSERGRLFAQLVVLFELEAALELETIGALETTGDLESKERLEAGLEQVRRGIEKWRRRGR